MSPTRRIAAALAVLGALQAPASAGDLLIRNARVVDGTGAAPREATSVLVRGGRIAAIGPALDAPGAEILDASGLTALPGLIDSHVHFVAAPGSGYRGDSDETISALNERHLRAYLACGVTTVLDAGAYPEVVRDIRARLAGGTPGPRYLTTGPYVRPPGGYGHPRFGEEADAAAVESKLDLIQSLGGAGVKIALDPGVAPFPPEVRDALVAGARRRGLPLYVHAQTEAMQAEALDLGAHALMHLAMGIPVLVQGPDLSDAFVLRLAQSGVYQLTTLSLFETFPSAYPRERLDDPVTALVVPELELATARAPDAADRFAVEVLAFAAPWTFEAIRPALGRVFLARGRVLEAVRQGQRNLRRLARAGVPIVAATDAPSPWPAAVYHFHGVQFARELELMGEAGLSPAEVIVAATRTPARMLGLDAEIGTLEPGKRADLVLVRGDPLRDLGALRGVAFTLQGGVAKTPAEWMGR